jgi:hypothetical protein
MDSVNVYSSEAYLKKLSENIEKELYEGTIPSNFLALYVLVRLEKKLKQFKYNIF